MPFKFSILIGATFKGKNMLPKGACSFIAYCVTGFKNVFHSLVFW